MGRITCGGQDGNDELWAQRHSIIPRARQMEDLFRRVLASGALDSSGTLIAQTQQNPE